MSNVGIELNLIFDRFKNFMDEFSELAEKHDLDIEVDEKNMQIIINLDDLVDVQTSPINKTKTLQELKNLKRGVVVYEKKMDK